MKNVKKELKKIKSNFEKIKTKGPTRNGQLNEANLKLLMDTAPRLREIIMFINNALEAVSHWESGTPNGPYAPQVHEIGETLWKVRRQLTDCIAMSSKEKYRKPTELIREYQWVRQTVRSGDDWWFDINFELFRNDMLSKISHTLDIAEGIEEKVKFDEKIFREYMDRI